MLKRQARGQTDRFSYVSSITIYYVTLDKLLSFSVSSFVEWQ